MPENPFGNIKYGPLKTEYHRRLVDGSFKETLMSFLNKEVLPQVSLDWQSANGTIKPEVNEERLCGPNSAVKNIFKFKFAFWKGKQSDTIEHDLIYYPENQHWKSRRNEPFYLYTHQQREKTKMLVKAIPKIIEAIRAGSESGIECPSCKQFLMISVNNKDELSVKCPTNCFSYYYSRDSLTFQFAEGVRINDGPACLYWTEADGETDKDGKFKGMLGASGGEL